MIEEKNKKLSLNLNVKTDIPVVIQESNKDNKNNHNLQIILQNVKKSYFVGDIEIKALNDVNLEIKKGDFKMILGPSGSGKSTLLNILGGLDSADSGKILIRFDNEFKDIRAYSKEELAIYRREKLGIIFQFYNLIPILSALENVELSARFSKIDHAKEKSIELLNKLGLDNSKIKRYPNQLSGGEQQRVAIARALIKDPALILADEPTGNLDSVKSDEIYRLLKQLSKEFNKTILIVTHNEDMANKYAEDHIYIRDGKIIKNKEEIQLIFHGIQKRDD